MNSNLRTRITTSMTNTIGRPVGVLPVDPRNRTNKKYPSSADSVSRAGLKTSSNSKHFKRTASLASTHLDLSDDDDYEFDLKGLKSKSPSAGSSRQGSSKSPIDSHKTLSSAGSSRYGSSHLRKGSSAPVGPRQGSSRPVSLRQGSSKQAWRQGSAAGSSRQGSSRQGSSRERTRVEQLVNDDDEKDDRPKKTIEPDEILQLCQENEFHKVYEICLHGEDLTDIGDLEKFRKVRILDLSCNHIKKIDNLDFNPDLKELKLYGNRITVIENLDNLKELCSLQLQHNRVRVIGRGLSCLKKLHTLRLDSNCLLKLETSDLVACVQLTVLNLSSNMLDNLSALNYLPNLEELYVTNNRLRKVTEIQRCRKLQEVDLSGNRITDLSGLAGLPHLQILDISNNHMTSLKSLGKLKNLEELNVSGNQLTELEHFCPAFTRLQILTICDNVIVHWQQICNLSSMSELVEISLSGNPVTLEGGEMPHYHSAIQSVLPNMEVVDGALVKRQSSKSAPLMRPMSASSIISTRQMDTQLKAYSEELVSLEKSITAKFDSLRATCESLPAQPPAPSSARLSSPSLTGSRPTSRAGSRARLREAMDFVAQNSEIFDETGYSEMS